MPLALRLAASVLLSTAIFFARSADAQSCNLGANVGPWNAYNAACTDPLRPYCYEVGQPSLAPACTVCTDSKVNYSFCDCPAGSVCVMDPSSPYVGTCGKNYRLGSACASSTDCPIEYALNYNSYVGYTPCYNGKCVECDPTSPATPLNATIACPGGSPYPLSSRPGETRTCNAQGYWVGGGAIATAAAAPTTAPPSSTASAPTTTTSEAAERRYSTVWMVVACTLVGWALGRFA